MIRTLFLATALILSGCVQPSPEAENVPVASAASTGPAPNATIGPVVPDVTVELDSTVTRKDAATLFVNTTAPLDIVVRHNGNETVREAASPSTKRALPLSFGLNTFDVALAAPGFSDAKTFTVVRLAMTTLEVDFGVFHPGSQGAPRAETFEVWIDVDSRPSAPAYAAQNLEHFDAFTAHDQLVVFEQTTGRKVDFEFFPSFQGYGVSRIDGAGSPVSSDAPPWWCYEVNGGSADGISIQPVLPGDVISWALGSCT